MTEVTKTIEHRGIVGKIEHEDGMVYCTHSSESLSIIACETDLSLLLPAFADCVDEALGKPKEPPHE